MPNLKRASELLAEVAKLEADHKELIRAAPKEGGTISITLFDYHTLVGKVEVINRVIKPDLFDRIKEILIDALDPTERVRALLDQVDIEMGRKEHPFDREPIKDDISDQYFCVEDGCIAVYPQRLADLAGEYEDAASAWAAIDNNILRDKARRGVLEPGYYKVKACSTGEWVVARFQAGAWYVAGHDHMFSWDTYNIIGEKVV